MPRSRRRRAKDRRQEAEQRLAARQVFEAHRRADHQRLGRYVKAVLAPKAGETIEARDGNVYQVQDDGSVRRVGETGGLA